MVDRLDVPGSGPASEKFDWLVSVCGKLQRRGASLGPSVLVGERFQLSLLDQRKQTSGRSHRDTTQSQTIWVTRRETQRGSRWGQTSAEPAEAEVGGSNDGR